MFGYLPSCEIGSLAGLHCVGWASWLAGFRGLPVSTSHLTISGLTGAHHHTWLFRWALGIQAQVFLLANALTPSTPALFRALFRALDCLFAVWLWHLSSLEMAPLTLLPPSWMVSLVHDGFELDEVECHICEADLHVSVSGNTLADLR